MGYERPKGGSKAEKTGEEQYGQRGGLEGDHRILLAESGKGSENVVGSGQLPPDY